MVYTGKLRPTHSCMEQESNLEPDLVSGKLDYEKTHLRRAEVNVCSGIHRAGVHAEVHVLQAIRVIIK